MPRKDDGGREGHKSGGEIRDAAAEEKPESREGEEAEEGKEDASGEFQGRRGRDADGLEGVGNPAKEPDGELGPVDGTAIGGVVHVGVADAEMGGFPEIAGVG